MKTPMWTLDSAVTLIREVGPYAFEAGWNLHLGGGVLDRGESQTDVDILAMPRCQVTTSHKPAVLAALAQRGWIQVEQRRLPQRDIRKLSREGRVIDLIFVSQDIRDEGDAGCSTTPLSHLTSREYEVLRRVAEGASSKQIANELFLSVKTIEKHRQTLMDKTGIHDIAGLTRYAIAHKVIEVEPVS